MIPILILFACGSPSDAVHDTYIADTASQSTDSGDTDNRLTVGTVPDDFTLVDQNTHSLTYDQPITVSTAEGSVTAWHFFQAACGYCSQQALLLHQMQEELDTEYPELNIRIYGVNRLSLESYIPTVVRDGEPFPILQDTLDVNAWDLWNAFNRDLFILDNSGAIHSIITLTPPDEGDQGIVDDPENYEIVKAMLVDAATP